MSSIIHNLAERKLIHPPHWLPMNVQLEVIMGSVSYGVSSDMSDVDIYALIIPKKEIIFPHLAGVIKGFGYQGETFNEFSQHHIKDMDKEREYDITAMNIVKFFELAKDGNPNIIDMLFVPQNCVLHITQIGNLIRENRRLFLSKRCFKKFKGYAYGQVKHLENKQPVGKRMRTVEKYGWDVKFGYHIVRLLNEIEQILITGDLNLQENNEQLKAIRRGDWTEQQVRDFFAKKEQELETAYLQSKLREEADEAQLRQLLVDCLEQHYGDLSTVVVRQDECVASLREIDQIIEKLKSKKIL